MSSGARRLRLVGAPARKQPDWAPFEPIRVHARCVAVGETRPDTGASEVARDLALTCAARSQPVFLVLCEPAEDGGFANAALARLGATDVPWVRASVQGEADLRAVVQRAEREAPDASWVFLGDVAVLGLSGPLKVVIDRPGGPVSLAPRARTLKAAAHLVLSAPRSAVASGLAREWLMPTAAP